MSSVTLIRGSATFSVKYRMLVANCDFFAENAAVMTSPYRVRSLASLDVFRQFVEAIEGKAVKVTNQTVSGLSQLCVEFGFRSLSSTLSAFRNSASLSFISPLTPYEFPISAVVHTLRSSIPSHTFTFVINGREFESDLPEAVILLPAVCEQLLIDSCARTFIVCDSEMSSAEFTFLQNLVSGNEITVRRSSRKSLVLLSRLLLNTAFEQFFLSLWLSGSSSSDEITVTLAALFAGTQLLSVPHTSMSSRLLIFRCYRLMRWTIFCRVTRFE
jgi:hypothetical protein